MATAKEAREWAHATLRGIGNSLYTPFCGDDGDDIDWDAYRRLVRYCVGELRHPMLWCTSGVGEFWSLTLDERKRLLEVAIEEGRAADPDVVVQACTAAMSAKDCLELTRHAQQAGADIVYLQTPMMEAHGGEGVLKFFRYIADRTDIALGMFNSPSSGYVLTPAESARIYDEVPAVCATKEGAFRPTSSRLLHELAPDLVIWECDLTVYRAGWLRAGIVGPAQLGTAGYLYETPQQPILSEYWDLIWNDKLIEAMDYAREVRARPVRCRHALLVHLLSRAGPTTSRTGAAHSSTRRRCSAYPSGTIRIRGHRRRCCQRRGERRFARPINASVWSANSAANRLRKTLPIGVQYGNTSSWKPLLRRFAG